MSRLLLLIVSVSSASMLAACHVVDHGHYSSSSGRKLSGAEVNSIRINQTTGEELISWFGAPSTRADRPDGSATWTWCESRTESSSGHVLFLWDRDSSRTTTHCTSVELRDGIVRSVHND